MYTSDMCLVSGEIVGTQDNDSLVNGAIVVMLVSSPSHNEELGFQKPVWRVPVLKQMSDVVVTFLFEFQDPHDEL